MTMTRIIAAVWIGLALLRPVYQTPHPIILASHQDDCEDDERACDD